MGRLQCPSLSSSAQRPKSCSPSGETFVRRPLILLFAFVSLAELRDSRRPSRRFHEAWTSTPRIPEVASLAQESWELKSTSRAQRCSKAQGGDIRSRARQPRSGAHRGRNARGVAVEGPPWLRPLKDRAKGPYSAGVAAGTRLAHSRLGWRPSLPLEGTAADPGPPRDGAFWAGGERARDGGRFPPHPSRRAEGGACWGRGLLGAGLSPSARAAWRRRGARWARGKRRRRRTCSRCRPRPSGTTRGWRRRGPSGPSSTPRSTSTSSRPLTPRRSGSPAPTTGSTRPSGGASRTCASTGWRWRRSSRRRPRRGGGPSACSSRGRWRTSTWGPSCAWTAARATRRRTPSWPRASSSWPLRLRATAKAVTVPCTDRRPLQKPSQTQLDPAEPDRTRALRGGLRAPMGRRGGPLWGAAFPSGRPVTPPQPPLEEVCLRWFCVREALGLQRTAKRHF